MADVTLEFSASNEVSPIIDAITNQLRGVQRITKQAQLAAERADNERIRSNQRVFNSTRTFNRRFIRDAERTAREYVREWERAERQREQAARRASNAIQNALIIILPVVSNLTRQFGRLTGTLISSAANMETFRATIQAVTNDAGQTTQVVRDLLNLTVSLVGIDTGSLFQFAARLMAAGLTAQQAQNAIAGVTRRIAEQGKGADVTRRVLEQFTQAINSGTISMQDFRPIAREMPLLFQDISDALGVTVTNLDDFRDAAAGAGGNTQAIVAVLERMAQVSRGADLSTLNAQMDILSDSSRVLAAELGEHLIPAAVALIRHINAAIQFFINLNDSQQRIIAVSAAVATALAAITTGAVALSLALGGLNTLLLATTGLSGFAGLAASLSSLLPLLRGAGVIAGITLLASELGILNAILPDSVRNIFDLGDAARETTRHINDLDNASGQGTGLNRFTQQAGEVAVGAAEIAGAAALIDVSIRGNRSVIARFLSFLGQNVGAAFVAAAGAFTGLGVTIAAFTGQLTAAFATIRRAMILSGFFRGLASSFSVLRSAATPLVASLGILSRAFAPLTAAVAGVGFGRLINNLRRRLNPELAASTDRAREFSDAFMEAARAAGSLAAQTERFATETDRAIYRRLTEDVNRYNAELSSNNTEYNRTRASLARYNRELFTLINITPLNTEQQEELGRAIEFVQSNINLLEERLRRIASTPAQQPLSPENLGLNAAELEAQALDVANRFEQILTTDNIDNIRRAGRELIAIRRAQADLDYDIFKENEDDKSLYQEEAIRIQTAFRRDALAIVARIIGAENRIVRDSTDERIADAERRRAAEVAALNAAARSGAEYAAQLRQISNVRERLLFVEYVQQLQEEGLSFDEARRQAERYLGFLSQIPPATNAAERNLNSFNNELRLNRERLESSAGAVNSLLSAVRGLATFLGERFPDVAGSLERAAENERQAFEDIIPGQVSPIDQDRMRARQQGLEFITRLFRRQRRTEERETQQSLNRQFRIYSRYYNRLSDLATDALFGRISSARELITELGQELIRFILRQSFEAARAAALDTAATQIRIANQERLQAAINRTNVLLTQPFQAGAAGASSLPGFGALGGIATGGAGALGVSAAIFPGLFRNLAEEFLLPVADLGNNILGGGNTQPLSYRLDDGSLIKLRNRMNFAGRNRR